MSSIFDLDIKELAKIISKATEQVITLADKYGVDRDEAYQHFATMIQLAGITGTFKSYEVKKPSSTLAR